MTVTAEYYAEHWGAWADSDELTAALRRAEIIVDGEIFPSGYTVSTAPEAWREAAQNAVCAQAAFILENGGIAALSDTAEGGAVSLGKFSYSGGAESGGALCALCPQAACLLESTGLLYRGVSL